MVGLRMKKNDLPTLMINQIEQVEGRFNVVLKVMEMRKSFSIKNMKMI
jgi:hypothetical protein